MQIAQPFKFGETACCGAKLMSLETLLCVEVDIIFGDFELCSRHAEKTDCHIVAQNRGKTLPGYAMTATGFSYGVLP